MKKMTKMTKILLIDDDPEFLKKVRSSLKLQGFFTKTMSDSKKALEHLKSEKFNVVVTDIFMPGMNGFQVIEALKREKNRAYVIALTGDPEKEIELAALESGADAFLSKPLDLELLLATITGFESSLDNHKEGNILKK